MSLWEALSRIPDPRKARGKRYPLPAILSLLALALLLGRRSLAGVARLAEDYGEGLPLALGFRHARTPSVALLSTLLRLLDAGAVEAAVREWVAGRVDWDAEEVIPIDGKTLRGSTPDKGALPAVHLLAAFAPHAKAVLAQVRVDAKTNEHKAALQLLGLLPGDLSGRVVTGDAAFCQKEICAEVRRRGGDYLPAVKDNQPKLKGDIDAALAFDRTAASFSP